MRIAPVTRRIQRPPTPEPATSVFVPPPVPVVVAPPAPVFVSPPAPVFVSPPAPVVVAPPTPVMVAPPAPGFMIFQNCPPDKVYVLDGGLATELERDGFSLLHDPLWSARILHENPEAIVQVHNRYLESGAEIITTASYQASLVGFQKHLGLTFEQSKQLLKSSVDLANKARKKYFDDFKETKEILVAGSIGSYGAALADGSEYTGDYCEKLTHEELINWHRPRIDCLIEAGVDLLAFETIPSVKEGEALMKILKDLPSTKAWLSFSCQSMHQTSHKEDIGTSALTCMKMASLNQLVAVGFNCCSPEYVESLLKDINAVSNGYPLIVYPNSGEKWDSNTGWTGGKVTRNHTCLESWINSSAKIIGGCCRTTPGDISQIAKYFQRKNNFVIYWN
ncbi:homocysteine S-methyltransferase YbgG [Nephila pilipes]|uniref:Homocysteine S-methyltransferase YbgG n=1 Tax=Nephila pilipes TaxID=299642 RepID=A0A8X6NES5_NEPPI|nr:homocysteine S-methyltransferase YbgG [Nephila pilipes]